MNELKKLIKKRLLKRLKEGMVEEIKKLQKSGVNWKRLEEFGLEYRYIAQYLQKKIDYQEMIERIQKESEYFAKRQMTWFKRDKRIRWIKNYKEAKKNETKSSTDKDTTKKKTEIKAKDSKSGEKSKSDTKDKKKSA